MATRNETGNDFKLLDYLLVPSWLSVLIGVLVGIAVIGGTIILTLFGTVVQQSLLGLNSTYRQSSLAANVDAIDSHFTHSALLGNILVFMSWGLVGLAIYSIAQGFISELKSADETAHELRYVNINQKTFVENIGVRLAIRVVALGTLLLAAHYFLYKFVPYAIGTAHASALHLGSLTNWLHSLLAGVCCVLGILVMNVLLHFVFLRPRLFGNNIVL